METMNRGRILRVALAAAEAGAEELMSGFGRKPEVRLKGAIDLVTDYDFRSEKIIRGLIARNFPEHLIIGEEEGQSGGGRAEHRWYIDPLDGTTNFAHGHPFFAVSIGLAALDGDGREQPLAGVVLAPALGETYWAVAGGGAWRRQILPGRGRTERRLAVTATGELRQAMLNTGFPYDVYERGGEILHPFGRLLLEARCVRRAGSAALDLAYVAAGVADAYWETGVKPWDVAAGLILLTEAGGQVSDYHGEPYRLGASPGLVGSNGPLHQSILSYLR